MRYLIAGFLLRLFEWCGAGRRRRPGSRTAAEGRRGDQRGHGHAGKGYSAGLAQQSGLRGRDSVREEAGARSGRQLRPGSPGLPSGRDRRLGRAFDVYGRGRKFRVSIGGSGHRFRAGGHERQGSARSCCKARQSWARTPRWREARWAERRKEPPTSNCRRRSSLTRVRAACLPDSLWKGKS